MLYERDIRYQVELQDSVKTEIIKEYEAQTGVSARSRDDLKQAFEMQGWVKDDLGLKLSEAEKDLKAMGRKKNFWKVATVVGIPVGIGFGAVVGTILTVKYIK